MPVFNPDSKFMIITNTILDYVKIGLLFLLFSIPVITIGAAACAGMTVAMKIERDEAPVVWGPFWKAFKENFKQCTICTLVILVLYAILGYDWYLIMQMERTGLVQIATVLIAILTLLLTIISMYIFAIIARYELPNKAVLHNAVIYTLSNFPKNLLAAAILVAGILVDTYVEQLVPIVIAVIPALEFFYFAKVCVKSFRKLEKRQEHEGKDENADAIEIDDEKRVE